MRELILTNANIVLPDAVIEGSVAVRDGLIADLDDSPARASSALDLEGDTLIAGLVELHTDNIERHVMPRPKTYWPADAAALNHDREIVAAGITTVFNALSVGAVSVQSLRVEKFDDICAALNALSDSGALKADHFYHLRCEISYPALTDHLDSLLKFPQVRLLSVMDHTPGQRQFLRTDDYAIFYQGEDGLDDKEMADFIEQRRAEQERYGETNRRKVIELARQKGIVLASHDDATPEHVEEALRDGMAIAEFPTTLEAARASHEAGMAVLMGGPNMVRGGSHSGNISARDLAAEGLLDIISSDYIPASLLYAALVMDREVEGIALPEAIRTITRTPAQRIGLTDRGEIAPGRRADLVRFRPTDGAPVIRDVWRDGEKIA